MEYKFIKWFEELRKEDVPLVGGKGANLGEMTSAGIPVPPGFCVTAEAYKYFVENVKVEDGRTLQEWIMDLISKTNVDDSRQLQENTAKIREKIISMEMPEEIASEIEQAYKKLSQRFNMEEVYVAVRSSATAEDLPEASFAGQQETYLDVLGVEDVKEKVKKCWASLWTARATFYRAKQGFDHSKVYLSAVVQKMVNSETSGVMFTANPVTNDRSEIMINAAWGLGEAVVSGAVSPDEYIVEKGTWKIKEKFVAKKEIMIVRNPETGRGTVKVSTAEFLGPEYVEKQVLTDDQIIEVAQIGARIEEHYGWPQDIEWAYDKDDGKLYIVQSRPVTTLKEEVKTEEAEMTEEMKVLLKGLGASPGIGAGKVVVIFEADEIDKVKEGDVLVTTMTNPDMVPAMKRASAIVTDEGGRTCHAAIVSRELGIPAVVGTKDATKVLKDGMLITVDGTRGVVYEGIVKSLVEKKEEEKAAGQVVVAGAPLVTATEVKANVSMPEVAERAAATGADGVGLLRAEHMILGIGAHPVKFIKEGKEEELIERLVEGIRTVATAFYPRRVWYRTLDAPTNEFRELPGGEDEPEERNPMLGWRGIRRGLDQPELLKAEFKAIKRLVDEGYDNLGVMLPLVSHVEQLREAKRLAREVGLEPHKDVEFGVMVETPSSALIIEDLCKEGLDFISFGTNDLTQYTLAIDRDNERVFKLYDETHPAVLKLIKHVIKVCKKYGVETSICGQAASDPKMAKILVRLGIDSLSANPDAVQLIKQVVAREEQRIMLENARRQLYKDEELEF
ncbi:MULTISPECIES: phosphoenolpyruvate synthase [Thermococcus]|uniref:Phosphoenolpyruvate synthase n=1 Tax=Thermococcus sibiricus (strain DSM 12597 / MM 739) TaxID=604354 RepID=C6A143_THESM|nr:MULTISPECIES: phosphoenolpyruvate synthase [Thermococcus]KUK28655.1 MAG: Phosphoenolpyruvate synthase [Thermococcus sp. 40_45]HII66747.1 phosphoenolpyruvate synthase [Thermococcaceae archaeon]ACS89338.1 Phosphoenolpyruvate synthetase [Thermococcus sibiricus MM 739]MBC7095146.1 phosphoenolpyruvate synthase [Thermococcus sp.]MBC7095976.1 phosphoenolpyruvate synthase [Thermococcus sp.]